MASGPCAAIIARETVSREVEAAVRAQKPGTAQTGAPRRVLDVMHRGVVTCAPGLPARKVALMMTAHRIHAVVVTAAGGLPRLVTDREIASALYSDTLDAASADEIALSAPLVGLSDSVDDALARMHERASTHAVAVDRSFRPLGIISVLDLLEARERRGAR
jgi:CBS domain-containing protein